MDSDKKNFTQIQLLIIIISILFILYIIDNTEILNIKYYKNIDSEKKNIYFGQTLDLTHNKVSINYSIGYELAFNLINRIGGIDGYKLKIILYDDKYEPELASANAKMLIDYYNVLAIIGTFGTPTTISILDNSIKARPIPLIAPFSAGLTYRKYYNKYLILTNSTILYEYELIFKNLILNNIKNISIIYQNDSNGLSSFNSIVEYMIEHNSKINIVSTGNYKRNTEDLKGCFESVFNVKNGYNLDEYSKSENFKKIQAVIIFCSQEQISYILGFLKKIKPELFIYYNFFVDTNISNYKDLANYNKNNIYQTNLIYKINNSYPILYNKFINEVNNYKTYHKNSNIDITSSATFFGFYNGLLIIEVLKNIGKLENITRKKFIDMFYKIQNFDIYGLKIGPFVEYSSNKPVKYATLNKLNPNTLEMEEIDSTNKLI